MKKNIHNNMMQLINTVQEALNYALTAQVKKESLSMLAQCFSAVLEIEKTLTAHLNAEEMIKYSSLMQNIKQDISILFDTAENDGDLTEQHTILAEDFMVLCDQLEKEPIKIEVLFLPYKSSMWDSMESVWRAAAADDRCECFVVPIPYFDRKPDHSMGQMHYEGGQFPSDVPIVPFSKYNITQRCPDVIYIHNPYDHCNYVTSVHPDYYSFNLKKYTDMLVYVPYGISGGGNDLNGTLGSNAIKYVDCIIAPSEYYKGLAEDRGISKNKLAALGSPKADKAIEMCKNPPALPDEWKLKLNGKKVILLNTSITACLAEVNWTAAVRYIIYSILNDDKCGLIWRPHPLLLNTIETMRPAYKKDYMELLKYVESSDNGIIDETKDIYLATAVSHGLISDYSSLMFLYTVTGKPILNIFDSVEKRPEIVLFDYFSDYFMDDGISLEKFIEMIKADKDPLKDERRKALCRSLLNLDGSCGVKVHDYIITRSCTNENKR